MRFRSMTLVSSLLSYGSVSTVIIVCVLLFRLNVHTWCRSSCSPPLSHLFICRFAVYFIFVYFTLSRFVIKFAACSRQISIDMTCAFDRKWYCNGMSTAYNGTNSNKFTFYYMTSIAHKGSEDRSGKVWQSVSVFKKVLKSALMLL